MNCQADIEKLADQKILEAECLLANNFFDGSYYLAGYAVELMLKACVCKTLGIDDFFDFGSPSKKKFPNQANLVKPFKVHDLQQLIILSGVYKRFEADLINDPQFKINWSIVSVWSEENRYLTGKSENEAKDFITSVKEVVKWIQRHL